jgi:uncharacterized membrane protein
VFTWQLFAVSRSRWRSSRPACSRASFYAYSSSVSLGLGDLDDRGYVAAMQAINDSIPNGVFVLSFVGAPLLLIVATALHAASHSPRLAPLLLAGGLVIGGGLLVTFLANVPLNDDLAGVDPNAGQEVLARARADYEDPWNTLECCAHHNLHRRARLPRLGPAPPRQPPNHGRIGEACSHTPAPRAQPAIGQWCDSIPPVAVRPPRSARSVDQQHGRAADLLFVVAVAQSDRGGGAGSRRG